MTSVSRLVSSAAALSVGLIASGVCAGSFSDLNYTSATGWDVGSNGSAHHETFAMSEVQFYDEYELSGGGTLEFDMWGYGNSGPNVDSYYMRTNTETGWPVNEFFGAFYFDINDDLAGAVIEYAGADYQGKHPFTAPVMEVYELIGKDKVLVDTLNNLSDSTTVSGGSSVMVKIIWTDAPMQDDGTITTSTVTVYPTAVPGGGALALLGLGAVVRRRRRLS